MNVRSRLVILSVFPIMGSAIAFGSALNACASDTLESGPDAGFFDGGEAGGNATTDCNACLASACTGEWSSCFASSDCVALYACINTPSCDAACRAACACANPAGVALFAVASACEEEPLCGDGGSCVASCVAANLAGNCGESAPTCATTPVVDASSEGGLNASACVSCVNSSCGDQRNQCPASSDCDSYVACAIACTSAGCVSDCASTYASGNQAASEFAQCVTVSCSAPCAL